jgi:Xaa-Pro aminopeptidase
LSEREIAQHLEYTMGQLGADDKAFDTIVATGSNTAIPHHQPTGRIVESGDLVKIDFGAKLDGYHSDCTRMFVAGPATQWQVELHDIVRECQEKARDALHSGVLASQVDRVARDIMLRHGKAHLFTHGLGHGVGLEIHEDPYFTSQPATTIEKSTVVTVEPGAYIPNQGGVRIEDTVVVTEVGHENLTNFTYDLITIG